MLEDTLTIIKIVFYLVSTLSIAKELTKKKDDKE